MRFCGRIDCCEKWGNGMVGIDTRRRGVYSLGWGSFWNCRVCAVSILEMGVVGVDR